MIKIKLRKSKVILSGIPGPGTYDRQAIVFIDEGHGPDGQPLLSIRNSWEDKYILYRRRVREIVDEQGGVIGDIAVLNELTVGASDLPEGGQAGQILMKNSGEDFDAAWSSLPDFTLHFENKLV